MVLRQIFPKLNSAPPCSRVADRADSIAYAPDGFGSHHWIIVESPSRQWFVTADPVDDSSTRLARTVTAHSGHVPLLTAFLIWVAEMTCPALRCGRCMPL